MQTSDSVQTTQFILENKAVLIYFYNDDCPPCVQLRPKVERLISEEFGVMRIMFVNAGGNPETAASYGVFASPTVIAFFDGKEYARWSKFVGINQIREGLERPYKLMFT
jgi:thioredoxin-like negative regulator of GroEL